MAVVNLNVPHFVRALQRGEHVVLQDVLRVERAGDDLLAWVRQIDGSIQLQRLEAFFLPGLEATFETRPAPGQQGDVTVFTAKSDVSSTAFGSEIDPQKAAEMTVALQNIEGDVLWVQLLANDLAHVDQAWALLADRLQTSSSTLERVYVPVTAAPPIVQDLDVLDTTLEKSSAFSLPDKLVAVPELQTVATDNKVSYVEYKSGVLISGRGEAGARVQVQRQQGSATLSDEVQVGDDGQWTLRVLEGNWGGMGSGAVSLQVRQIDAASNASQWSSAVQVPVRLEPVAPVQSVQLVAADDTGVSTTDGLTRHTRPTVTGQASANAWVRLVVDGNGDGALSAQESQSVLGLVQADGQGQFSWNGWTADLTHGTDLKILAVGWDEASGSWSNADAVTGLPVNVPAGAGLHLRVDTVAPLSPVIDTVTDDDIINVVELAGDVIFRGTAEAGAQLTLRWLNAQGQPLGLDAQNVMADAVTGAWSVQLGGEVLVSLGATVKLEVRATDAAGNTDSGSVATHDFSIDTLLPAAPSVLQISADTGTSPTDGLTNATQQVLSGTARQGSTVTVFKDLDDDGVVDAGESLAVVTANLTTGVFETGALTLADGTYRLRAMATVGGVNSTANQAKVITIDSQAPGITMTTVAGDTPTLSTFNGLINLAKQANGTSFGGAAENGLQVSLTFKNVSNETLSHNGQPLTYTVMAIGGTWQITLTPAQVAELAAAGQGAITAVAAQTDGAGNTGLAMQSLMLDTVRPEGTRSHQAEVLALQANGELGGGLVWNEVFDGVMVPVALPDNLGSDGQLILKWGNQTVSYNVSSAEIAQGYATVTVPLDKLIAAGGGLVPVKAIFIDAVGNASSVDFPVTADSIAASVVSVDLSGRSPTATLDTQSYHRLISGVHYSNQLQGVTVWLSGEAGAVVLLKEGGTTLNGVTLDNYGMGSVVLQLTPAMHTLSVESAQTRATEIKVFIDNSRPGVPTLNPLVDTLINATERNGAVEITGTCDDRAEVSYWLFNTVTGVVSDTVTTRASGTTWAAYISLEQWFQVGDGTLKLYVTQTDWAGNASDPIETVLTLDSAVLAPVLNTTTADDIVNATEALAGVALSGAAEPGAEVRLVLQGTAGMLSQTFTAHAITGAWTLSVSQTEWNALGEGNIRLTSSQTDRAGNVSANTVRIITLDTQARNLSVDSFTGDNHLHLAETALDQTLGGQGEAGATIQIHLGSLSKTSTVGSNGRWITSFTAQELAGLGASQALTVTETDLAGNTAQRTAAVTVNAAVLSGTASLTTLGNISWGSQAAAFTLHGTGPMASNVYLHLVGVRGVVDLGPAAVDTEGAWSINLTSSQMRTILGSGDVTAQLWAVNASGQQSTALVTAQFILESEIPSPTLSLTADDGVINLVEKQAGVVIGGTGVANHTIEVTLSRGSATVKHTTQVAANGTWQLPLVAGDYSTLGDGTVNVSVVQKANGSSSVAVSQTLTVDVTPPSAPHVDSMTQAQAANATSELSGGVTAAEAVDGLAVVIPLASNASVGDLMEVFWGNSSTPVASYILREGDIAVGNAKTLSVRIPGDEIALRGSYPNGDLAVTYRITDAAGNTDVVRTAVSGLTVTAPPQAPQLNAVMTDGYINLQEYNQTITLTGQVTGSGAMSLRLTGSNGTVLNLVPVVSAGGWTQTLSQTLLDSLGEGVVAMSATQVIAGVTSPTATGSFIFDKTLPGAVSAAHVQAALEKNSDTELAGGLLATSSNNNLTEAYDGTVLYVPLAVDAATGDSLRVFWACLTGTGGIQVDVTLAAVDVLRGYAAVTISEAVITQAGDNPNLRVEAQSVDKAGNAGVRYEVWTCPVDAVPERPTLDAVGGNNILNISEMAGAIQISGLAQAGRSVQVQLLKGTSLIAQTVTADLHGEWNWILSGDEKNALATFGQGILEARARQLDVPTIPGMPGNPSQWQTANVMIDTVAPNPPTIADITSDNRISANEEAAGVRISGTGEANATVSLVFMNGSSHLLNRSGITVNSLGVWETVINGADFAGWPSNTGAAGVQLSVQATQSDVAENPSNSVVKTFRYSDDVVVPPSAVTVQNVADGYFNAADAVSGLHISGQGTTGSYVRVRITVGDLVTDLPLVQVLDGDWEALVTGAALAALGQGEATVQVVQRNSNLVDADESTALTYTTPFVIDTVLPVMQNANLSVLDGTDLSTVKAHAKQGDVLLIKVRLSEGVGMTPGSTEPTVDLGLAGTAVYDAARSAALGPQWMVFSYTVTGTDNALEGLVGATGLSVNWHGALFGDAAGNALSGNSITPQAHGIRIDTRVPGMPTVQGLVAALGESAAADAISSLGGSTINLVELNGGKALVRVNLGADTLPNDTLKLALSWSGGAQSIMVQKTLLAADMANGYALVSLPPQALAGLELNDLQAKAQVVDVAGNASDWTVTTSGWTLDTRAPVTPLITDIATDNKMSAVERNALQDIAITNLEAGATVEAWINGIDSASLQSVQRTVSVVAGVVTAAQQSTALAGLADGTWTLSVRQTDAAGNVSTTASKIVALDTNVPGDPLLSVAAATDGWLNISETSSGLSVTVDLRVTRTKVGDELAFSWGSQSYTHVLSAGQPETLLTLVLPASFVSQASTGPATGENFDLSVKIVDTGGNESGRSGLSGKTLDTLITAPTITAASLDIVTALDAKSTGIFAGTGAEAGATVVVVLTSSTTGQVRRMSTVVGNDGAYSFTLTPSDYKDLGGTHATSTIHASVTQTDLAGNTSTAVTGSFQLDLSLSPPAFFDFTGDNQISLSESMLSQSLKGTGSPGATVTLNFYDASASSPAALLSFTNVTVNSVGQWTQSLTSDQFTTLAGGATGTRSIRVDAKQSQGGSESDVAKLVFVVDKLTPTLSTVTRFDGNGDGANNDGLLVRFSEPVQSSALKNISTWLLSNSHSFGKGARVEAIGEVAANGTSYAQEFRIYWGTSPTVVTSDTVTVSASWVVDAMGNLAAAAQVFNVPSLLVPGAPTPPVTITSDNRINATEYAASTVVAMTHAAAVAGSQMRVYLDGVLIRTVAMTTNATSTSLSLTAADWGNASGQKSLTTQIVQTNGSTSAFSTPKPITLDTLVDSSVRAEVLTDNGVAGVLNQGDVLTLYFKEAVSLVAGSLPTAFGASATVAAVDAIKQVGDTRVYASAWNVTLGTTPTLSTGQAYALSAIKDLAGNTANLSVNVRSDVFSQPTPSLVIDNVAINNVVDASEKSSPLQITVRLTEAKLGDVIQLTLDGNPVGSVTVGGNGQSTATFSLDAALLGADGERVLGANLARSGATAAASLNRSVYVATDRTHWSAVHADTVWFDPDTLMTLKDGAQVTSWTTSTATRNVQGSLVNLVPKMNSVPKLTDASGHVSLYFHGASSLYSTSQIANPRVDLTGMSDFSMLKLLGYPTAWGYTMSRELDGVHNGVVYGFRHHFGGLQTTLSSHYAGWGSNTIANAATVSSWLVMNGYNDASAQSLAVNNRILSTTANSLMFANSGKGGLGGVGTLAVGGSGWIGSGSAEFVTGVMGDQIAFNSGLTAAMRGEVATYLAAKYQSEGRKVQATTQGASYDLSVSANANPILDDLLQLNASGLGVGNDTIKTAGADYVNAGSGNDVVSVTDLAFRYIDGGLGRDTLKLDAAYQGRSALVLADFVSNVRGMSGVTSADERVNAAGYHGLAGLEVLDLRQTDAAPSAVVAQVLSVAPADVAQLSETHRLEVLLGDRDVLLTSGFSVPGYGHFLVEGQSYSARYSATINNQSVALYVRGGRLAPDLEGMSLNGAALQLDFNTALTGAAPLGDFSITPWGGTSSGLNSITSLNNRQSLYMEFSSALGSPIQMVYSGSMKDEFGRSMGHNVWGVGTEGNDMLDASSWSSTSGAAILAGSGNDQVTGTAGADLIIGGLGADTLTGGLGSDRFAYNTVTQGAGGTGGLGGTGGDVITDFNTSSNSPNADVLDLSDLFQLAPGDSLTGDASQDAQTLMAGGYIDLVRVNSGKDLQVWVDRDGGDVMGQLVTLQDMGTGLGTYFTVSNETSEQLLQRLLTEGRMQVTHA